MPDFTVPSKTFDPVDALPLRVRGAYEGTVTEEGMLVSDNRILFHRYFARKEAAPTIEGLLAQRSDEAYAQDCARDRLAAVRDAARWEGRLLGCLAPPPVLPVRAELVAGFRFRPKRGAPWQYVWVDAHRLRLLMELFRRPLAFACGGWDQPVLLRRGTRAVGCIAPASPCPLDVDVQ